MQSEPGLFMIPLRETDTEQYYNPRATGPLWASAQNGATLLIADCHRIYKFENFWDIFPGCQRDCSHAIHVAFRLSNVYLKI